MSKEVNHQDGFEGQWWGGGKGIGSQLSHSPCRLGVNPTRFAMRFTNLSLSNRTLAAYPF